ncbi:uncharacterized protein LOC114943342 isoform X2 [Nylanderia fulva]|uniref:uncharacterized protein LOC114939458 isoform X2 n=1 Tax=Nylanderia fulva TaxID=613905 RepID=UPI0010FADCA4|nr:uncharacterized protein LOC114939458 isoform X2 [Nylanderia fulva]XP_029174759.1 uncharacterized protein LOC114943342 isoform X2 [Nylanderia fulva]
MFYIEEIKCLLTQFPQKIDCNSIQEFCNIEMSHYEKLSSIRNELDRYIKKLESEQLLEETCTFIAQGIQPRKDVCYTNVSASSDTIAQEVLNCLKVKHPNHSIFSTSREIFSYWKNNNIKDNHWDETESTQIMDTLQEYIFSILNFRACISSFAPEDIKWICIDYVLQTKYGQDIIVYAIFHSVARRLGLRCDVLDIENEFYIFWKPEFVTNNLKNARNFYITNEDYPNWLTDNRLNWRPVLIIRKMLEFTTNIVDAFIRAHIYIIRKWLLYEDN